MPQVEDRPNHNIPIDRDNFGGGGDGRLPGGTEGFGLPTAKIGLWVLLAVMTVIFSAVISAYVVRKELPGWQDLPKPWLLWLSTALLLGASVFLQRATWASRKWAMVATFSNLRIGGILGFGFVAVQLLSWAQLRSLGYYMTGNPSASFFYLMTALHGLHMLGGLVAWSVVASRKAPKPLSIELVAQYWHFLLLVWAVLFGVMLLK